MTSPITHEKIIEVLRAIVEDRDATEAQFGGMPIPIRNSSIEAARDLYQRLQAEKEGGEQAPSDDPRDWPPYKPAVIDGPVSGISEFTLHDRAFVYRWAPDNSCAVLLDMQSWEPVGFAWYTDQVPSSFAPALATLNQEGGDAAAPGPASSDPSRRHVAPPASATAGTGRATVLHEFDERTEYQFPELREILIEALASEHQRGLAEGKRIGIEKAAKVADDAASQYTNPVGSDYDQGAVDCAHHIERQIRALTGDPQT